MADSTRPVVSIDWNEARTICQQAGGDLPTEAQWEYAARGGSRFPWSFGDNEGLLKYHAWYADNAKEVQAVGSYDRIRSGSMTCTVMPGSGCEIGMVSMSLESKLIR